LERYDTQHTRELEAQNILANPWRSCEAALEAKIKTSMSAAALAISGASASALVIPGGPESATSAAAQKNGEPDTLPLMVWWTRLAIAEKTESDCGLAAYKMNELLLSPSWFNKSNANQTHIIKKRRKQTNNTTTIHYKHNNKPKTKDGSSGCSASISSTRFHMAMGIARWESRTAKL